jgi:vacuolar protein-sorting-associated protein 4
MDIEAIRNKVKELATDAVKCDKLEEYEKAYDLYVKAANQLQLLIKYDQNPYSKKIYTEKAKDYCIRAKDIKDKKLSKKDDKKKGEETDEEKKKLEDQLSGCIVQEKPNVKWEDVAGLEKAKESLKEAVIFPIKFPQLFQGKRKPWKGILLYGPPGTGKSFLAKAAATETHGSFFSVSAANIVSKWMGESERLIKGLFDLARKNKPAVIFLDEIDSVMGARSDNENDATRRLKTEFLIQMQGVGNDDEGILVLGATNIPWALDPAVRRRFQKKIYISLPELDARKVMFELNLKGTTHTLTDDQIEDLAQRTDGFSGSDISTLTQDAIFEPVRKCQSSEYFKKVPGRNGMQYNYMPCHPNEPGAMKMRMTELPDAKALLPPPVIYEDFIEALKRNKATVNQKDLQQQEDFTREFGQEG